MNYSYTVSDICKFTGLKEPFIRRCIRECRDLLSQWSIRGDNNSILFEDSALKFFDRVKQLKEEGANLVQIKSVLLKELEPQGLDEKVQDNHKLEELKVAEASEDGVVTVLLNEYKSAQKEVVESHKNVVKAKDELIVGLKQQMFLLTDGRTPEEIRIRRKEEKVEQKELQQVRLRRVSLIGELKALEGKLFSGQKRLEILKQLEEIC
ncbi:MAG: hypothetical protein VX619_03170 [bacterium]|nr:hypothetical protein [bacterium]